PPNRRRGRAIWTVETAHYDRVLIENFRYVYTLSMGSLFFPDNPDNRIPAAQPVAEALSKYPLPARYPPVSVLFRLEQEGITTPWTARSATRPGRKAVERKLQNAGFFPF